MKELIAQYVVKTAKKVWDGSSLLTKIFILWAFGPALMSYITMDFRKDFKQEILAEAQQNTVNFINPMVATRNAQIEVLTTGIADLKTELNTTRTEIKQDIRELRSAVLLRLNHQP